MVRDYLKPSNLVEMQKIHEKEDSYIIDATTYVITFEERLINISYYQAIGASRDFLYKKDERENFYALKNFYYHKGKTYEDMSRITKNEDVKGRFWRKSRNAYRMLKKLTALHPPEFSNQLF